MSDPTTVIRAIEPAIHNALTTDGKPIAALVGSGVMSIEYHILDFSESQNPPNPNWVSRSQTITPPTGWQNVSVSVAMWNFDFYPQERPITYLGARAGVVVVGSTLQITAYAICRDSNADDAWRGSITLQVIFLG